MGPRPDWNIIATQVSDLCSDEGVEERVRSNEENITAGAIRTYEAFYEYRREVLQIIENLEQHRADMRGWRYNDTSRLKRTLEDALDCMEAYHTSFLDKDERLHGGGLWAQLRDFEANPVRYRDFDEPRETTHPQPTSDFEGGAN